jgi:CheY-like chemotaxis protein
MMDRLILLVDDSRDDAELAVIALREAGITGPIDVVRDGEEAIEYLIGSDTRSLPTCVLLDIKLPKVNGFEVLQRIRECPRTRSLPVIMLTSSDVADDVERAYELGANSYVRKPIEFSKFLDTVRQLGRYWLQVNQTLAEKRP